MSVIKKLSQELIGQIAAGEVVERPAAAVKELVENSIDAGAKNVTVELREGGISYLRVSDNGHGIPAEQIRMAFERHATSKISETKDLFAIQTLGFRGEALASIAAVSKVTCTTRTKDAAFGTRAVVEAGEFVDIRQAASPVGTTIVAEDLFYNTPVRLKFLKKPSVEAALVSEFILRLILSHPEVAFRFVSQGKTIYHSMGDGSVESALYAVYGREAFAQMRKVSGHMNGVILSGYVGVGDLCRGNRQQQSFFINNRYFKSPTLSRALEKGCEGRAMVGRFPMCALFLELPYTQVDVNVHPNKLEVRFQNEQAIAMAVETLVREAMQAESLGARLAPTVQQTPPKEEKPSFSVVEITHGEEKPELHETLISPAEETVQKLKPVVIPPVVSRTRSVMAESMASPAVARVMQQTVVVPVPRTVPASKSTFAPISTRANDNGIPSAQPGETEQTVLSQTVPDEMPLRLVGILFDTYWLFEAGDKLLMVDQHAAHERILYDRMMALFENERISQRLLTPLLVQLPPYDMALVEQFAPVLAQAGFEVSPFDKSSVAVHAIPTFFGQNDSPKELLLEALAEWQAGRGEVTRERIRRRVAQMACKRAIKGGDRLTETEVQGFLREMQKSQSMPTCPHGRPIVVEVTRYALEKRFKRVQ